MKRVFKGLEFVCGSARNLMKVVVPSFKELLICAGCINANAESRAIVVDMAYINNYKKFRQAFK